MHKGWNCEKRQHMLFQGFLWTLNCHWLPVVYETKHEVFSTLLKTPLSLAEVCLSSPFPFLSPVTSTESHGSPALLPKGPLLSHTKFCSFGSLCLECPSSPYRNLTHPSPVCSQVPSWYSCSLTRLEVTSPFYRSLKQFPCFFTVTLWHSAFIGFISISVSFLKDYKLHLVNSLKMSYSV